MSESDPILDPLNEKQREAVTHGEGSLLVFAGAGSGKTRTITHRIAHLIRDRGVAPYEILGVTFTNKAAAEMQERARKLVGETNIQPELRTFHSFGVRLLSEEVNALKRERNFSIYDDRDQLAVLKECLKQLKLDPKQIKPRTLAGRINYAKDNLMYPRQYAEEQGKDADEQFYTIYKTYEKILLSNNAFDFGDLILRPVKLLQENETVRNRWQLRFQHLLVDEFQDTNPAQFELAHLLAEKHGNIVAVGDDDQSIYSWRGADISNILNFEKYFPNTKTVRLERNYRSTQPILEAAHAVIKNNSHRKDKKLWTDKSEGRKPEVYAARNDYKEAEYVLETIRLLEKMQGVSPGDCAVFFRVNAQTRVFEEVFTRENMPYVIVSSVGFYERMEIKDLLAYLKILVNPADDHSLSRIINQPSRGIGEKTEAALMEYAAAQEASGLEALPLLLESGQLTGRAHNALSKFYQLYNQLQEYNDQPPLKVIEKVLEKSRYIEKVVEKKDDHTAESRLENIEELKRVAADFGEENPDPTLADFVEEITLLTDMDTTETEATAVNLMTLHAAKGLEFEVVFMAGMEEGLLPHRNSEFDPERKEEERRLCYVGFTRAKKRLYCSWSRKRRLYGTERQNHPSPFLREAGLLDEPSALHGVDSGRRGRAFNQSRKRSKRKMKKKSKKITTASGKSNAGSRAALNYEVGEIIKHPKFGRGKIVAIQGSESSPTASIKFDAVGEKRLALAYAHLEKIS